MNPRPRHSQSPSPDPALSDLLQAWDVDGSLPDNFHREVRRRIAKAPRAQPSLLANGFTAVSRFLGLLQRPTFALTYITAGILLGAVSGSRHAQSRAANLDYDPQVRYIASIDPYQMPRPPAP